MRKRSIHRYLLLSWVISGCFVLLASIFSLYMSTQGNWEQYIEKEKLNLSNLSSKLARQVSGELLLGNKGSSSVVIKEFEQTNTGLAVSVIQETFPCKNDQTTCFNKKDGILTLSSKIPYIENDRYLSVNSFLNSFMSLIEFRLILFSLLPVLTLIIIGVLIQRFILNKYIVRPIQNLVDVSIGDRSTQKEWPVEFRDIANKLSSAFEKREQAVYGQLAKGVIHDIKTLIHSIMSAADLALQEDLSQEAKNKRYSILAKACKANLPQMKEVIERTLDGGREISITKNENNLVKTIEDTIHSFDAYSKKKSVSIKTKISESLIHAPHDTVQLKRAFSNVIQNAIDEFDRDESSDRVILVSVDNNISSTDISFEDTGPGFKENQLGLRPLKSTKIRGSGIGLSIAKKVIEGHGGNLSLRNSTKLKGAKVSFIIPNSNQQRVLQ